MTTGIVTGPVCLRHVTGDGHPEHVKRLQALQAMLDCDDLGSGFALIPTRPAHREEIECVHTPEYVDKIASTENRSFSMLSQDTPASEGSYLAALHAAGGCFEAVTRIVNGELDNAFVLVRPPGHHAERSRAMGYCLFNNVAAAAHYIRGVLGLNRVMVVDWDVHHGNGTQHLLERDDSIFFFSIHQYPHYPGTGYFTEVGSGKGEGYTMNVPIPKGYGDNEYAAIFKRLVLPTARAFEPNIILVSAGFDTHRDDPLGGMKMTPPGFAVLTRILMNIARDVCGGKLALVLEGGYNTGALTESVKSVLMELAGKTMAETDEAAEKGNRRKIDYAVKRSRHVHERFWKAVRDA